MVYHTIESSSLLNENNATIQSLYERSCANANTVKKKAEQNYRMWIEINFLCKEMVLKISHKLLKCLNVDLHKVSNKAVYSILRESSKVLTNYEEKPNISKQSNRDETKSRVSKKNIKCSNDRLSLKIMNKRNESKSNPLQLKGSNINKSVDAQVAKSALGKSPSYEAAPVSTKVSDVMLGYDYSFRLYTLCKYLFERLSNEIKRYNDLDFKREVDKKKKKAKKLTNDDNNDIEISEDQAIVNSDKEANNFMDPMDLSSKAFRNEITSYYTLPGSNERFDKVVKDDADDKLIFDKIAEPSKQQSDSNKDILSPQMKRNGKRQYHCYLKTKCNCESCK